MPCWKASNPFAGPSVAVIRDIPIAERVPLKLSTTAANFFPWKTYFGLLFREYDLLDHVDGTIDLLAMPHDPEWLAIDATIIRWFYQTVSNDIFRTVVRDGDSAHTVWAKITGLFTDNKIQRVTFLQQEFFGTHQNDLSLDDYALKLKNHALHPSAGLGEDLSNAASNLTLLKTPTFEQAVAYLRRGAPPAPPGSGGPHRLAAGFSRGAQTPAPRAPRAAGSAAGFPAAARHPVRPDRGPVGPGHQAGQTGLGSATPAPGQTGPDRAAGSSAVAAVAVVAVAVATVVAPVAPMLAAPRPRTPPLRHGPPVTIRGPGSFTPTPCPCRAPLPGIMGPRRPPTRGLRGAQPAPPTPPLRRDPWDPALPTASERPICWGVWWRWRLVHGHRRLRAYGRASRDVWTSPVPSNSGYNYYLVILDDYSHFVWTFPLRRKSDVATTLTAFFAFVSTQFGRPIHALQTDNGKEFDNITIRSLLATHGAVFRLTCPYTSSQNGRAERMLRTLNDCVRTLLSMPPCPRDSGRMPLPRRLSSSTSARVVCVGSTRRIISSTVRRPPTMTSASSAAGVIPPLPPPRISLPRLPCVFLGYPTNTKGYRCYDRSPIVSSLPGTYFDELVFPFQQWTHGDPPTTPALASPRAARADDAVAPSAAPWSSRLPPLARPRRPVAAAATRRAPPPAAPRRAPRPRRRGASSPCPRRACRRRIAARRASFAAPATSASRRPAPRGRHSSRRHPVAAFEPMLTRAAPGGDRYPADQMSARRSPSTASLRRGGSTLPPAGAAHPAGLPSAVRPAHPPAPGPTALPPARRPFLRQAHLGSRALRDPHWRAAMQEEYDALQPQPDLGARSPAPSNVISANGSSTSSARRLLHRLGLRAPDASLFVYRTGHDMAYPAAVSSIAIIWPPPLVFFDGSPTAFAPSSC
ncbi:hypothetical protein QYE76_072049 [Lolium multiflorum]|uniref:Integrase catalytic domain-containing protein n=1 Tax=Lolium multiflorum TaxID=4521 RepID=A0AAD8QFG7_LOLMU|nr:hypothetical protein QYE76_072049 [Lolium multiflorum]